MLQDVERFARERPWLVAGAAAAAGLIASRFLKASSERRFTQASLGGQRGGSVMDAQRSRAAEPKHPETRATRVGEAQYAAGVRS